MINKKYRAQADLLIQVLPFIAEEPDFAITGGTAINLFLRDMPRLSVDIDLIYINIEDRETSLKKISAGLSRIKKCIDKNIHNISVSNVSIEGEDRKIHIQKENAQVKVEVNTVTRGIIKPVRLVEIKESVQNEFGKFAAINVVSDGELFGGKICAAIDRQHPRDLFDIKILFEGEGITDEIRIGFIVFLLSHNRPINEMLNPNLLDQRSTFSSQFEGMANIEFTYQDFENTRIKLVSEINKCLTEEEREFIINFKDCRPDYTKFPIKNLKDLPAVKWKYKNIEQLKATDWNKYEKSLFKLYEILFPD